jgi:ribonuclease P protein component
MRRSREFASVLRSGARARRGALVVHAHSGLPHPTAHVGLIVGRSVGNSVVRHRVTRRLRAQIATRLVRLPDGTGLVVRALPEAAAASSAALGSDLDRALGAVLPRRSEPRR